MAKPSPPSAVRAGAPRALAAAAACVLLLACASAQATTDPAATAQWEAYLAQAGRSSAGANGMDPFTAHRFSTPLHQVRSAAAYSGTNSRMRRVVDSMSRASGGQRFKVVAVGGVATNGSDASAVGSTDYVSKYANYLVNAFPKADIQIVRASAGLAPSAVVAGCPDQFLSAARDADLVLLEMVPSDAPASEDLVVGAKLPAAYEALVRQALGGSKKPAVLLVQGLAPGQGNGRTPFYITPEAPHYSAVAGYYGIPYVSLRNALWTEQGAANAQGMLSSTAVDRADGSTPLDAGHAAMADALVYHTQQTVVDLASLPYGAFDDSAQNGDVPTQTMYSSIKDGGSKESLLKDVSCAWVKGSELSQSCPGSIKDMCAADYRSRSAFLDSYKPGSNLSTGALIGVIVGSVVGGLLLIDLAIGLCVFCKRRKARAGKGGSGGGSGGSDVGVVIDDDAATAKKQAQATAAAPRPSIDGWNAALPEPPRHA